MAFLPLPQIKGRHLQEQRKLAEREATLADLERERDSARQRMDDKALVQKAIDLCQKRGALAAKRAVRALFPPDMDKLRGTEGQRLQDLLASLKEQLDNALSASKSIASAEATKDQCRLPGGYMIESWQEEELAYGGRGFLSSSFISRPTRRHLSAIFLRACSPRLTTNPISSNGSNRP